VKTQAFAKNLRALSAAALLAFTVTGPARAQFARSETPAARVAVDRNFLIGTWSDAGDCSTTVAFTPDGAYTSDDGAEGQWDLSGDRLTLSGEGGNTTLTIIPIDRNTMEVVGQDGSHDRSTRCAGDLGDVHFDDVRVA
jgi:hypothetical protein